MLILVNKLSEDRTEGLGHGDCQKRSRTAIATPPMPGCLLGGCTAKPALSRSGEGCVLVAGAIAGQVG